MFTNILIHLWNNKGRSRGGKTNLYFFVLLFFNDVSTRACTNIPTALGGLNEHWICLWWSWCAEIPLPTTWFYPNPWSQCWRTGQSQATFLHQEKPPCVLTKAVKIGRKQIKFNYLGALRMSFSHLTQFSCCIYLPEPQVAPALHVWTYIPPWGWTHQINTGRDYSP